MANQLFVEPPPPPPPPPNIDSDHNFINDLDSFFNFDPALEFGSEEAANLDDFEINFDDLGDIYFPSEDEEFLIPGSFDHAVSVPASDQNPNSVADSFRSGDCEEFHSVRGLVSESAGISSDQGFDKGQFLKSSPCSYGSSGCDLKNVGKVMNTETSSEMGNSGGENTTGPVSSQGSGNCDSSKWEGMNCSSPASSECDRYVVDQKVNVSKRKKDQDGDISERRTIKCRRSSANAENANSQRSSGVTNEEDEKKKARLMRNRESAQLSRQRKKQYVDKLEEKVRAMHSTITDLNNRISFFMAENASLRQQLSGNGLWAPPPPGMYPHPPMGPVAYPWVPYGPYAMKPHGSNVPLVPIPRLKPQQASSASKAKKSDNKKTNEGKSKTKKVASVSFLGLLFFILLFGGLVPMLNVKYGGGLQERVTFSNNHGFYDQQRGKILTVNGHSNGSVQGRDGYHVDTIDRRLQRSSDELIHLGNSSESLVASLYVPRNDKLVKIDGNLIIHSFLASEKAVASQGNQKVKSQEETSLAIPKDLGSALAIPEAARNQRKNTHMHGSSNERQRALGSGSADTLKNYFKVNAVDGKWFREGIAGPMLSSGMCTEVFQFDISAASSPGAIVASSAVSNVSTDHYQKNTTNMWGANRRILRGLPVPIPRSKYNNSQEQLKRASNKESLRGKNSTSMVVSVLVDPREAGDSDGDGMMTPKSLSRIFVVVLVDSVKYVTYSCILPRSGHHLVTT